MVMSIGMIATNQTSKVLEALLCSRDLAHKLWIGLVHASTQNPLSLLHWQSVHLQMPKADTPCQSLHDACQYCDNNKLEDRMDPRLFHDYFISTCTVRNKLI